MSSQVRYHYDGVAPTVTLTMAPVGQYQSSPTWQVTATFSESIEDFHQTDITLTGPGTISNFATSNIYTAEGVDELTPSGGTATWQVGTAKSPRLRPRQKARLLITLPWLYSQRPSLHCQVSVRVR